MSDDQVTCFFRNFNRTNHYSNVKTDAYYINYFCRSLIFKPCHSCTIIIKCIYAALSLEYLFQERVKGI